MSRKPSYASFSKMFKCLKRCSIRDSSFFVEFIWNWCFFKYFKRGWWLCFGVTWRKQHKTKPPQTEVTPDRRYKICKNTSLKSKFLLGRQTSATENKKLTSQKWKTYSMSDSCAGRKLNCEGQNKDGKLKKGEGFHLVSVEDEFLRFSWRQES